MGHKVNVHVKNQLKGVPFEYTLSDICGEPLVSKQSKELSSSFDEVNSGIYVVGVSRNGYVETKNIHIFADTIVEF